MTILSQRQIGRVFMLSISDSVLPDGVATIEQPSTPLQASAKKDLSAMSGTISVTSLYLFNMY